MAYSLLTLSPNGTGTFGAIVRHVDAVGPVVRLNLTWRNDGSDFEVELPHKQRKNLKVQPGRGCSSTSKKFAVS